MTMIPTERPPLSSNKSSKNAAKKTNKMNRDEGFYFDHNHSQKSNMNSTKSTRNSNSIKSTMSMSTKTNANANVNHNNHNQDIYANKVIYDSSNHWTVLTQMHGSVWPKVLLYCLANILNASIVTYLRIHYNIDLSFSDRGHTFMSMMVSFLMVTRSNIAYARYMEARMDLSTLTFSCRELISHATTFTRYDKSESAVQWRLDLARRVIKLLRTVVCVLEFNTTETHAWKVSILSREEKLALQSAVGKSNERSPHVLAMFVRSTIASHVKYLDPDMKLHVNKELKLYACVAEFGKAYAGLMKLVSTPFPFPLVQMTRTFLFIWIYTLPWVLVNDFVHKFPALIFTVFFITYAFVGLEFVAIELDDPFGNDDNDFDVLGLAKIAFEDISIIIFDVDGKPSHDNLKALVDESNEDHHDNNGSEHEHGYHHGRKYPSSCTSTSSFNTNKNSVTSNDDGGGAGSPLRKSQTTTTTQTNNNNNNNNLRKSNKPNHHKRLDSLTAWQIAKTQREEAGEETSMLLCNAKKKVPDELESGISTSSGINTGTSRKATAPRTAAMNNDMIDAIEDWHRGNQQAAMDVGEGVVGNSSSNFSSLYGSIMGSYSSSNNNNNNNSNRN